MLDKDFSQDLIYKYIGEYVVIFQWLEHRLREIGWLITDPQRSEWPPRSYREESNLFNPT